MLIHVRCKFHFLLLKDFVFNQQLLNFDVNKGKFENTTKLITCTVIVSKIKGLNSLDLCYITVFTGVRLSKYGPSQHKI